MNSYSEVTVSTNIAPLFNSCRLLLHYFQQMVFQFELPILVLKSNELKISLAPSEYFGLVYSEILHWILTWIKDSQNLYLKT